MFFLVTDSKVSNKTYIASVKDNKIVSRLVIGKFDHFDSGKSINFKISKENEFEINKFFHEKNLRVCLKEIYKIDTISGKFYLSEPPNIIKNE
ncbi:hypothetical protein TXIAM_220134 [Tenacibaculum xiamenense]